MLYLIFNNQIAGTTDNEAYLPDGFSVVESDIDDAIDNLYFDGTNIQRKPDRPSLTATWDNNAHQWKEKEVSIDEARSNKIAELDNCCAAEITSGFQSSALGKPYFYNSKADNQTNLIGAVVLSQTIPYTCTDVATGTKTPVVHTPAQLKQVMADGEIVKQTAIDKYHGLVGQVNAATTIDNIEKIAW